MSQLRPAYFLHFALPLLVAGACAPTGSADDGGSLADAGAHDDGGGPLDDDGGALDAGASDAAVTSDAGTPPLDAAVPSDAATPQDAGAVDAGDGDDGGPPPVCSEPGFVPAAQGCVPDAPEPFRSRSESDVCARWEADYVSSFPEWEASNPDDECDPGVVPEAALENALRRTNLYRWLAGNDPVSLDDGLFERQQACAVLQRAMGHLDHAPPADAPCYTTEGAAGAGSSNLAFGAGLAGSVDLYVGDNGVPSLGHRRWVLNPTATTTQFGHKENWSCMYSFSMNGSASPAFVSWPPPGFVPVAAARGTFSFSSTTLRPTDDTVVEVAVGDGAFSEVEHTVLGFGYGWGETLSFEPPGGVGQVWTPGTTLRVRVRNTTGGDVAWTTRFTGCE